MFFKNPTIQLENKGLDWIVKQFQVGLGPQSNQPELLGWFKKFSQPNLTGPMYTPNRSILAYPVDEPIFSSIHLGI